MSSPSTPRSYHPLGVCRRLSGLPGRPKRGRAGDEQGSIILVLLLIMVFSIVAVTAMTGSISQLNQSTNTSSRNGDLQAALAGVQVTVGRIRAQNINGYVVPSQLPCGTSSGWTNAASGTGSASFTTSVQYYDETPLGAFVAVSCTAGSGPTPPSSGNYLARAVVTSCSPSTTCPNPTAASTAKGNWRRVVSTYNFNTSNANIPGGIIYSYSNKECLIAVYNNGSNASGGVTLEATTKCSTSNTLEQFQYTPTWNLDIQIAGIDYCVQDPEDTGGGSSTVPITQNCGAAATAQWGVNDNGDIQGVSTGTSPAGYYNSYCLQNPLYSDPTGTQTSKVTLGGCSGGFNNTTTWQISPSAGAGGSQPPSGQAFGPTSQLVNYQEFGACLDVTNQNVGSSFLIDYMCKQFPDTNGYPSWNQRFCFQKTSTDAHGNPVGMLFTALNQTTCTNPANPYCLHSPLATPGSLPSQVWVTVTACDVTETNPASNVTWTEWGSNGGSVHDYTWTDANGYCLEANTANKWAPPGNTDKFSTIQVDTCNGSYQQKWNAPPSLGVSQIANTHEGTGTGAVTGP